MKKISIALAAALVLTLAGLAPAATTKANIVAFYNAYLALVSASDYVPLSRDTPEAYDAKFDAIARDAGFEDAAAALAASEDYADDAEVAALRKAVADKILEQYRPYKE
ncbi:conserved hypothetical protein [Solidesulfovibrio fructosivorans JJ]]|uniref:DUF4168 domain-containing protein n=1 Tax=Solidesulfovibrio fructosivorans JJ] TaxID=596151 RepID=E1JZK0_SOLFR|nr:hypothetical protein [Solidesulfovibrio fructosivorans]EFL50247.1 conserved hypothetical protein [Solidesulfovibrio fructosivorans JJ]]